jgi:hypothetical protein
VTLEAYSELGEVDESVFYTRAKYDIKKKSIVPAFALWPTLCVCKKPENPDILVIACEG